MSPLKDSFGDAIRIPHVIQEHFQTVVHFPFKRLSIYASFLDKQFTCPFIRKRRQNAYLNSPLIFLRFVQALTENSQKLLLPQTHVHGVGTRENSTRHGAIEIIFSPSGRSGLNPETLENLSVPPRLINGVNADVG